MDYKPFLDKIGENSTAEECVHVMVDCTGALMDELHSSVEPIPSMFLPNVIAAHGERPEQCASGDRTGGAHEPEGHGMSMETLATRANQMCSAVEGAQCLWDEADRYSVLPRSDLDALASMIERMQHFQLGFEAGLAAAAAEAAQ